MRTYYVYILANKGGMLYVGVTNDILKRVYQHKRTQGSRFTTKFHINRLVYYEEFGEITLALEREKEIKKWRRSKKIALIESSNPRWRDLSADWYDK